MEKIIKPGFFGKAVSADSSRILFDILNEQLIYIKKPVDYLFIGDSITQHWDLELYFNNNVYKINRGIGGDTTEYILKRSDADVFQLNPKNIIYMAGTNDLLSTAPDLWWRTPGADKETVIENISENIESFIKKCNGCELYICSVIPANPCEPYNKIGYEDMVKTVNNNIKSLCEKYNAHYVDYYSKLLDENGKLIKDHLTHDGIHPNGEGYKIMSDVLKNTIKELA